MKQTNVRTHEETERELSKLQEAFITALKELKWQIGETERIQAAEHMLRAEIQDLRAQLERVPMIVCKACGRQAIRTSNRHKYCRPECREGAGKHDA